MQKIPISLWRELQAIVITTTVLAQQPTSPKGLSIIIDKNSIKVSSNELSNPEIRKIIVASINKAIELYLEWMEKHAKGTRGLSRFRYFSHGDSGKNRARALSELCKKNDTPLEQIIAATNKTLQSSSKDTYSLRSYLIKSFAELSMDRDEVFENNNQRSIRI